MSIDEKFVDEEYKVSDLAKLLDMTPEAIRHYESKGIITPRHDENNRYRYYLSTEFSRLFSAKVLRSLGFSLSDIKTLFYEQSNVQQSESMALQASFLKAQLHDIERQIEVLEVFEQELSKFDALLNDYDVTENVPFWLVPIRSNYSYYLDNANLDRLKDVMSDRIAPRYSYILRATMEDGLPCTERYTGYSIRGRENSPSENAIYVPARRVMRMSWRLIAGERFDIGVKRSKMFERLRSMGVSGDSVQMFGHTINISTEDDITYLNHIAYVPLDDKPLVDWDYIAKIYGKGRQK